jgi:hypothetical protein
LAAAGLVRTTLLALAVGLLAAPTAQAALETAFDGATECSPDGDGIRSCPGIVESFDGVPIDVNLWIPPAPPAGTDGPYPLVMDFHGWGGSKLSSHQRWTNRGYAYFSMSDRGWGESCGGLDPKRPTTQCANGHNRLMDTRYEVRDAQELAGLLVDDGIADPGGIAATGGSYGGGMSMALAALRNRKMLPNGDLAPWRSPAGTPISLAAAAPDIPWTDLAYSLMPTGRTLDFVADAPYTPGKIGVLKQSFVSGLYAVGLATSNYAPPGSDPDLTAWFTLINAGEPYDGNPIAGDIVRAITRYHSSYYIDDSVEPAPLLISNGWTDDLFPPDEAIRFYNRTKASHPDARVSLLFSDHGHQRGQNKAADSQLRALRRDAFFDFHVKGEGSDPGTGVETLTQRCGAPSDGPYRAENWRRLAPGEIRWGGDEGAKLIAPAAGDPAIGAAYDPIAGPGACATAPAADQPGLATYRTVPAPAAGWTLMGSPTIVADIMSPGPNSYLAARLLDVDPATGEQTLVARGLFRPETTANLQPKRQIFQLHPNGYRFEAGHIPKLELLPSDPPYSRPANGQMPVTVSSLEIRLPVLEEPGSGGVREPRAKFAPAGYELAPDYADAPVDSDGDGIADPDDACPNEPGPENNDGCPLADPPDRDGDGVPDAEDACPDQPGPAGNGGCPKNDGDGDGIDDPEDACPEDPGPADSDGCPEGEETAGRCERRIVGTDGPDRLIGTHGSERIDGGRGDDRIKARRGDDCVRGQGGNDRINAGAGADRVNGGRGADRIDAGAGADRIRGGRGADRVNGGRGADRVWAGRGDDRIDARDGERDVIRCGRGRDRVRADRADVLIGCEVVRRR